MSWIYLDQKNGLTVHHLNVFESKYSVMHY